MKRHGHTPEQLVRNLREGERLLNDGKGLGRGAAHARDLRGDVESVAGQYGAMKTTQAMRLRELEAKNARLKS